MALVFPRDMAPGVRWKTPVLRQKFVQEVSRTRRGDLQAKDYGSFWIAEFTSVPLRLVAAEAAMADFDSLRGSVQPFFVTPTHRPFPSAVTSAAALDGASPVIASIRADNSAITISGLPAGLELSRGDFLSIQTSVPGIEFFRLARGGIADGAGVTPMLELGQPLRPSVARGDAITLVNPPVEMLMQPDGVEDRFISESHKTISFKAQQVIR
ncbi:hypothetical protein [Pseudooceanicola atlanticus]|uniref:hypothetical protein n=1 Tax=Pseudooceanicola atlanticus TaxID=1461694 RepID=UPI002354A4E1|nr:hypothetical protein [Pseudooceanicola atlanticus]